MEKEPLAGQEVTAHPSTENSPIPQAATPHNVGSVERWLSLLGGGLLLFRMLRTYGFFVGGAWIAAYLLLRGVTGRCALYRIAQVDGRGLDRWLFPGSARCAEKEIEKRQLERRLEAEAKLDEIDRTSIASFPASDPPATW